MGLRRSAHERGQALLELAVFGMIAIAALGFLIRVGMQMNYEQEIRMGAFRRALAAAGGDNVQTLQVTGGGPTIQDAMAVTYHYIADRQMPNPSDGFMSLSRSRTEASAFVEWGDRLTFAYENPANPASEEGRMTQPRIIVRSNNDEQSFRQNDFSPLPGDVMVTAGIVGESTTTNTIPAGSTSITQTTTGTTVRSSTSTCSNTVVLTSSEDSVGSCIGGGTMGEEITW